MTSDAFHRLLVNPKTSDWLNRMLADNERVDAEIRKAHHEEQFRRYIDRLFAQTEQH